MHKSIIFSILVITLLFIGTYLYLSRKGDKEEDAILKSAIFATIIGSILLIFSNKLKKDVPLFVLTPSKTLSYNFSYKMK